jgi:hypothetical protein
MEAAIEKLRETAINQDIMMSQCSDVMISALGTYRVSRLAGDIAKVTIASRMNGKLIQPDPMR